MTFDGTELVPDPPREGPQYILVGHTVYAMIQLAADPAFWRLDWRKRKRLFRKAGARPKATR